MGRPEILYRCEITPTYDEAYDPPEFFGNVISYPEATVDEVLAWVRSGVESGTIEGEVVEIHQDTFGRSILVMAGNPMADVADNLKSDRRYLVIGPVSDGGEDRP